MASSVSAAGVPSVAAITGESGTGKTRLAHEFAASLPEQRSVETVRVTRTATGLPQAGAARRLALIIDDAHFLDPAAVLELPEHTGALLVLATFRLGFHRASSAEMRALAALVHDPRASELRLTPLSTLAWS